MGWGESYMKLWKFEIPLYDSCNKKMDRFLLFFFKFYIDLICCKFSQKFQLTSDRKYLYIILKRYFPPLNLIWPLENENPVQYFSFIFLLNVSMITTKGRKWVDWFKIFGWPKIYKFPGLKWLFRSAKNGMTN